MPLLTAGGVGPPGPQGEQGFPGAAGVVTSFYVTNVFFYNPPAPPQAETSDLLTIGSGLFTYGISYHFIYGGACPGGTGQTVIVKFSNSEIPANNFTFSHTANCPSGNGGYFTEIWLARRNTDTQILGLAKTEFYDAGAAEVAGPKHAHVSLDCAPTNTLKIEFQLSADQATAMNRYMLIGHRYSYS